MVDTVIKIMAGVLDIIGIATKEIKQGRTSESFLYKEVLCWLNHFQRNI